MFLAHLANVLIVAAPILGTMANILITVVFSRGSGRGFAHRFAIGFGVGSIATVGAATAALMIDLQDPSDAVGLLATDGIIYLAVSLLWFALAALAVNSPRIRLLHSLSEKPDGMTFVELRDQFNDTALLDLHVVQLIDSRLIARIDGNVFPRRTPWLLLYTAHGGLQRALYGQSAATAPASALAPASAVDFLVGDITRKIAGRALVVLHALGWFLRIYVRPVAACLGSLVLPSRDSHADAAKLTLIGLVVATFFLFTAVYYFPGGAKQFFQYGEALLHGTTLGPAVAQRDAGYPILLLLSGYFVWHSTLGIVLFQALFAILMPVLVYISLVRISPSVAFYTGLISILSVAPFYFMKWIHHDQTYIFFMILVIAMMASFLQSRRYDYLYYFTFAAIGASFSRPAGNLLFPVLLAVAFIAVRGRKIHYLACLVIFVAVTAGYQWHRYEIFDMRNRSSMPSYTGQQIFYNLYVNSGEFGVRLSPALGPSFAQITQTFRRALEPNIRNSPYMKAQLAEVSNEFANEHILRFTPDEFIEHIYDAPNYEYWQLITLADQDDQQFLKASWEIARAHPLYVARYALRNLQHFLFDPGFSHTRNNVSHFHRVGLQFMPFAGGVNSDNELTPRALREVSLLTLPILPINVQDTFAAVSDFWKLHFYDVVYYTSVLMIIAWVGSLLRLSCLAISGAASCKRFSFASINDLVASIIAASMFLLYNALVTSFFAEPDYRYYHFTELLRIMISGFGVAMMLGLLFSPGSRLGDFWRSTSLYRLCAGAVLYVQRHDIVARPFAKRPLRLFVFLAVVTAGAFAWWASFMIAHTG